MQGTLGIILSISLAATFLAVVIAFLVVKCYLNWKRQHKKERRLAETGVQQLVVSSQPVDFIPLLIQDRLEEEEEDDDFDSAFINCHPIGGSNEDISCGQTKSQTNWKEAKIHPPLQRLNSASCVLDRYGQRVTVLSKPQLTNRRESLFFEDSADESLGRRCFSAVSSYSRTRKFSTGLGSWPESANSSSRDSLDGDSMKDESFSRRCYSAASSYSRPRKGSISLRSRSESNNSLSRESLDGDSTLPDPTPHMRKSVVSTVNKNAPPSKMEKKRRHSTSKVTHPKKPARKKSRAPQNHGNVVFKMTYQTDQHTLEVHLINATELPIRHGRLLDAFARLSLKTSSKRQRFQSKVNKKTCNPIFDEKFVFDGVFISEFQQARLKIKLLDRLGVSRCEPIGESVIALADESITWGEIVTRTLQEKADKKQCAGELQVSLCHEATSSYLKVKVMKIKDLPKSIKSLFVAVELTYKDEILQKYQTKTKKKNLVFDEEFTFEVATNSSCTLENFGVQFAVFQHDFIRGNEILGHVRLGMDTPLQSEVVHWKAVVLSPHKPIAEWHKLHRSF